MSREGISLLAVTCCGLRYKEHNHSTTTTSTTTMVRSTVAAAATNTVSTMFLLVLLLGISQCCCCSAFVPPSCTTTRTSSKQHRSSTRLFASDVNLDGVEQGVHSLRLQVEAKDGALLEAEATISNLQDKIQELSEELKQTQKENAQAQKDLSRANARISHLEKKFNLASLKPPSNFMKPPNLFSVAVPPKKQQKVVAKPKFPEITDWLLTDSGEIMGTVNFHPSIKDGDEILTSPLADPKLVGEGKVVVTKSGSKYKLGVSFEEEPQKVAVVQPKQQPKQQPTAVPSRDLQKEYKLTGDTIGDGKYVLAGKPKKSTNGRCFIWTAYATDSNMDPIGPALAVKITSNKAALQREWDNLQKVWLGVKRGVVINCLDYYQVAESDSPQLANKAALVMERGIEDLKDHRQRVDQMSPDEVKRALHSAVQCLQAIHNARMVWTDLKSENFILVKSGDSIDFKAIDLESAVPVKGNPLDYTPEACPPEFALAFKEGDAHDFTLEYNYDVWSLGMLAFELSSGQGFFDGWTPETIMNGLGDADFEPPNVQDNIADEQLADLISLCLSLDPKKRPSIQRIAKHPYFTGGATQQKNIFGW